MTASVDVNFREIKLIPDETNSEHTVVRVLGMDSLGRPVEWRLQALGALALLNQLRAFEERAGLRQRNRQDRSRILVGRLPRVDLTERESPEDRFSHRVVMEVWDQRDADLWHVSLTLQDALFLQNEIGNFRKQLAL